MFFFLLFFLLCSQTLLANEILPLVLLNLSGTNNEPSLIIKKTIEESNIDVIMKDDKFNETLGKKLIDEYVKSGGKHFLLPFGSISTNYILELMNKNKDLHLFFPITGMGELYDLDQKTHVNLRTFLLKASYFDELKIIRDYIIPSTSCIITSNSKFGQSVISEYSKLVPKDNLLELLSLQKNFSKFNFIGPYGFYNTEDLLYTNAIDSVIKFKNCKYVIIFSGQFASISIFNSLRDYYKNSVFFFSSLTEPKEIKEPHLNKIYALVQYDNFYEEVAKRAIHLYKELKTNNFKKSSIYTYQEEKFDFLYNDHLNLILKTVK